MPTEPFELPMRIVVDDAIPGLAIAMQRGKAELVAPARRSDDAVTFDFEVTVNGRVADGRPRLLGPFVQGPPDARFVYLAVGKYAGQAVAAWAGRVKVPLSGIGAADINRAQAGARLAGRIAGRSPKGGPALASVPLLPPGWAWVA